MSQHQIKLVEEGSAILVKAINCDKDHQFQEAYAFYIEAIQCFHDALVDGYDDEALRRKFSSYINRAEEVKKLAIQPTTFRSNLESEIERADHLVKEALDFDERNLKDLAYDSYVEAAQFCLQTSKKCEGNDQIKVQRLAQLAIHRAEEIKTKRESVDPTPSAPPLPVHSTPQNRIPVHPSAGKYTPEEIAALKKTSRINGLEYLPFLSVDLSERFAFASPFCDPAGLPRLNVKQKEAFGKFCRPSEIMTNPCIISVISPYSIKQTIVPDCSFVSSLAVCALYERRFKKRILTSKLYPQNRNGEPYYNPSGKYMVKLHMNGCKRKVIIDDRLPTSHSGRLLCSSSNNPNELWVSLFEKAYIKLLGGYDFPGSTSSTDMYALTGWIPERISLKPSQNAEYSSEQNFERLFSNLHAGTCLVTVGTNHLSPEEEEHCGLGSSHAYAVLDIRKLQCGTKLFKLKNPWSRTRWKGNYSDYDTHHWTPELQRTLSYNLSTEQNVDNGVFWIDYPSILRFFEVASVSWNPQMFSNSLSYHHCWPFVAGPRKDNYSCSNSPQYVLQVQSQGLLSPTWVLLSRHFTEKNDFAENKVYMSLVIYKNNGKKVYNPTEPEPFIDGVRINTPHYLCKIRDPTAGNCNYTIVITQYEKLKDTYYTLKLNGSWGEHTAVGPYSKKAFESNPTFQVQFDKSANTCDFVVEMKAPKQFGVRIDCFMASVYRDRMTHFADHVNTDAYRPGYCVLDTSLQTGIYKIIVSTYLAGQQGPFILTFRSNVTMSISKLR